MHTLTQTDPEVNEIEASNSWGGAPIRTIIVNGDKFLPFLKYTTKVEWIGGPVRMHMGTCSECGAQKIGSFIEAHNFVNAHEWDHRYSNPVVA